MSDSSEDVVIRLRGEDAGGKALLDQLTRSIDANAASAKKHAAALNETSAAGDKAGASADHARGSFEGLSRGLELLTTALAAEKLLEFARSGLEAEVEIVRLSKETGASTEALSVLGLATQETGGNVSDLAQAFRGLSRSQGEVVQGNGQIAEAYHAIGLSVEDIQGLKPEELFKRVADAQARYSDGLGKSAALQQIFGRNAQELLPVLNAVAGEGLDAVTERARALGIVLDQETAEKVDHLDTQLTDLKAATVGVAEQVTAHLVPGLTDLARASTSAIAGLPDGVKRAIDYVVAFTAAVSAATVAVKLLAGAAALFEATPVGLAITAIAGFVAILGVVYEHEKQEQQVAVDRIATFGEQTARAKDLTAQYEKEAAALARTKNGSAANTAEKEKLKKITDALRALGPDYAKALGDEATKHDDVAAALKRENAEREQALLLQAKQLSIQLALAQSVLQAAQQSPIPTRTQTLEHGVTVTTPDPDAKAAAVAAAQQRVNAIQAQLGAALGAVLSVGAPDSGNKPPVVLPDLAAARARIAQDVEAIKADMKGLADAAKSDEQANSAAYAQGLEDLATYYENRRNIVQTQTTKEIADLARERTALARTPTSSPAEAIQLQTALASIDQQINEKRRALGQSLAQLNEEERAALKQLLADVGQAQATVLNAEGQTVEAARATIDTEVQRIVDTLAKLPGIGAEGAAKFGAQFRTALTNKADFDELQRQADVAFAAIANQKATLDAQLAAGTLGQQAHDDAITALERANLPQLHQIGDEMERIAHAANDGVGNPELIKQADAFNASLTSLGVKVDLAAQAWANFKDNAENALEGDLVEFLGSTIDQVHSVGDAFRQLALSAVQSLQRIVAELLVLDAIKLAKKTFGIGDEVAAGTAVATAVTAAGVTAGAALDVSATSLAASGGVLLTAAAALSAAAAALGAGGGFGFLGFAGGGVVAGPGTGTSDSILARVSAGEGILTAETVRRIRPETVHQLNRGAPLVQLRDFSHLRAPGYAAGGVVGSANTAAGMLAAMDAAGGGSFSGRISLEEGLVYKHLETPRGGRIILSYVARNANKVRAALGLRK